MNQDMVEAHASVVALIRQEFSNQVRFAVDEVLDRLQSFLTSSLKVEDGIILGIPENTLLLASSPGRLRSAVDSSSYRAAVDGLASILPLQMEEFAAFWAEMSKEVDLPKLVYSDADMDLLTYQIELFRSSMLQEVESTVADFSEFITRSTYQLRASRLTQGVSEGIRRLTSVVPMAFDHTMLFFRLLAAIAYRKVEDSGIKLSYKLVGPYALNSREFCVNACSKVHTGGIDGISLLSNGHKTNPLLCGGGYGCRHWWWAVPSESEHRYLQPTNDQGFWQRFKRRWLR